MQDKEIKDAIASILKKEVGALSNVIPSEIINSMANNLSKDCDHSIFLLLNQIGLIPRS